MKKHILALFLSTFAAGCGTQATGDDTGGGDDDDVIDEDVCGFDSDRFLPYEVGLTWTYQVTDLESGERKTKDQSLDETVAHPDFGDVIVQTTGKLAGSTRSLLRLEGDRVVRYQQEDLDTNGVVERTTTYDPGQIRIDESPERIAAGASWEEAYVETAAEPGVEPVVLATTDRWDVVGEDVPCESPLGSFRCLHLRRTRTEGGVAVKEFFFARGVGKVRESGDNVVEELVDCGR